MKLLTLNTHSLQEENYPQKLEQFIEVVLQEKPDIIAMQEVNQTITAPPAGPGLLSGFFPCPGENTPIREDNHAAQAASRLSAAGLSCSWTWISAKVGYGKYDEGMALLCLDGKIRTAESYFISKCRDYQNWKTRKVLGIQTDRGRDWFYTVHMGWWLDEDEPFSEQWKCLGSILQKKDESSRIWLMGDFNSPAEFRGQGYDCIKSDGWQDTYTLAKEKGSGYTVEGCIDGWRPASEGDVMPEHMRMDHIWCNKLADVEMSRVLFNGSDGPVVSDHYGVLVCV